MNPALAAMWTALPDCEPRRLVSDLFHALSQPLTSLCCSLELTLQQTPTQAQYRERVAGALAQAERASWLSSAIRELLDAAESGEPGEILQLQAAVRDAVSDALPLAESAGMRLGYLPQSVCPVYFAAQRLRRALFHLLGFVVGWGRSGALVEIKLSESGKDALLRLTVSGESAVGEREPESLTEEDRARLLSQRLGLGIAWNLFEAAGGTLCAGSEVNGISLEVRLPLAMQR
ncbi:MAG: sensor histidine kinase [Terriglobales bacterium]